jgi:hypothetical protein
MLEQLQHQQQQMQLAQCLAVVAAAVAKQTTKPAGKPALGIAAPVMLQLAAATLHQPAKAKAVLPEPAQEQAAAAASSVLQRHCSASEVKLQLLLACLLATVLAKAAQLAVQLSRHGSCCAPLVTAITGAMQERWQQQGYCRCHLVCTLQHRRYLVSC